MSNVAQRGQHSSTFESEGDNRNSVREAGQTAAKSLQDLGSSVKESAREGLEAVRDRAGEMVEQGRTRALAMEQTLESRIQSNPLAAIAIAVGTGFVLGAVFSRRD